MALTEKKIVIIGGGFAGLNLVLQLQNRPGIQVVLVDKNNYNFFPPLLYQVATGFLEPSSISYPFRRFLRKKDNIRFRMGDLIKIIPQERKILLSNGELTYDYLVLATGAETNYFGMENVARKAIPMKTLSDALAMRNFILHRLERASRTEDAVERKKLVTLVVAGAGPTGVELSGMFAEMRKNIIRKDYPELSGKGMGDIYLIDGANAVLAPMTTKSQQYSKEALEALGVQIKLGVTVKDFSNDQVWLSDGTLIETEMLIWSAGVTGRIFEGLPQEVYGRGRRLMVDGHNRLVGNPDIFAIGDSCIMTQDIAFPNGHPQLAQVAIQQAQNLGKNIRKETQDWKAFSYHDKGSMAIIGRNKAVADLIKPTLHFNGFFAWLIWLFIHLMSLLNYRNRLRTLSNWVSAYFTKDRYFRMIIRPEEKSEA